MCAPLPMRTGVLVSSARPRLGEARPAAAMPPILRKSRLVRRFGKRYSLVCITNGLELRVLSNERGQGCRARKSGGSVAAGRLQEPSKEAHDSEKPLKGFRVASVRRHTPLKRGVNEKVTSAWFDSGIPPGCRRVVRRS